MITLPPDIYGAGGMDPLSALGGAPSFTGGDAGPAVSSAEGNKQQVNAWMASSFAVGAQARAVTDSAAGNGDPADMGDGFSSLAAGASGGSLVLVMVGLVGLAVVAMVVKKGGGR